MSVETTGPFNGPFNGIFRKLENFELAEVFISEKGSGYEFAKAEFVEGTGIKGGSVSGVLLRLVEVGILATYPHPKFLNQSMYRIAWPVSVVRQRQAVTETVEAPLTDEAYSVALYARGTEPLIVLENITAQSPEDAAEKARKTLRAVVTQRWEL